MGLHGNSLTSYKLHVGEEIESGPSTASGFSVLPALHGCWSCGFTEGLLSVEHISAAEREGEGEGVGEGAPGEGRLGRKPT